MAATYCELLVTYRPAPCELRRGRGAGGLSHRIDSFYTLALLLTGLPPLRRAVAISPKRDAGCVFAGGILDLPD